MASVDNITKQEICQPGEVKVRAQLTGASSTYVIPLSRVRGHILVAEGANGATATISGVTLTITGTNDDWVDIIAWGDP